MSKKLLQIGKIGRPHGRFGEVRVHLFNDSVELLQNGTLIYTDEDASSSLEVSSVRPTTKCYLVRFDGYDYRDEVCHLANLTLWVDRDEMPTPEEDEFYCSDLIGFRVFSKQSENQNEEIGFVTGFLDNVETEVMIVEGPRILKRWLVPFISSVVLRVDIEKKCIMLAPLQEWTHEDQSLI